MVKPRYDLTTLLIPFVYFIAGATSLAGVATTFYYKDDLGLSIVQAQLLGSVSIIPWSIKPLYGLLSDQKPIFRWKRKPYLFFAGICGCIGYFSMALWVHSFLGALLAVLISGLGFALADVIVDGIVAERSHSHKEAGKLQSICRAAIMIGAFIVAYASGILVELIGPRNVFIITGILPLFTCAFAVYIKEEQVAASVKLSFVKMCKDTVRKLKGALNPTILWAAIFLFVWRATPNSGGGLNYFMIDELQFSPEFFGRLSMISYAAGIAGVLIFRKFLISIPLKTLFFWIMILSVVLSLPTIGLVYGWYEYLHMSPRMFAMADTLISGPLTEIAFLPLMVLIARVCPKGIEATMFAVLASVANIGIAVSDLGGAALISFFDVRQATETLAANYTHLDKVLWIAILSSLIPIPFLRFLPETMAREEKAIGETSPSGIASMSKPLEPGKREIS